MRVEPVTMSRFFLFVACLLGLSAQLCQGAPKSDEKKLKPYSEVITSAAKTQRGVIIVHQIDDKLYYELPAATLGKPFLWVVTLAQTQTGFGYAGTEVANRVARWTLHGEHVLLRAVDYRLRAHAGEASRRM